MNFARERRSREIALPTRHGCVTLRLWRTAGGGGASARVMSTHGVTLPDGDKSSAQAEPPLNEGVRIERALDENAGLLRYAGCWPALTERPLR